MWITSCEFKGLKMWIKTDCELFPEHSLYPRFKSQEINRTNVYAAALFRLFHWNHTP